jgi:spore coat protein JB
MAVTSEKDAFLRRISATSFAMWELHIYLDTHPNDMTAMALLNKNKQKYEMLSTEYQSKYGPLSTFNVDTNNKWQWIADPWPWEYCEE